MAKKYRILVVEGKGLNPGKYFFPTFPISNTTVVHSPFSLEKTGPFGADIVSNIEKISGVSSTTISMWELRVFKAPGYKWSEIYPEVKRVFVNNIHVPPFVFAEESFLSIWLKRAVSKIKSIFR